MRRFIGLSICAVLAFGCGDDDGGTDAGGVDAPTFDLGRGDVGTPDMRMVDSGRPDVPPTGSCETYDEACTADRGCLEPGFVCREEFATSTGGPMDPITNAPAGMGMFAGTFWNGGMCTPSTLTTGAAACKMPGDRGFDEDTTCGECGSCTDIFGSETNGNMCVRNCTANSMDNDTCRDHYVCSLTSDQCLPIGCTTDTECRVSRQETNGVPGLQFPRDCTANPAACGGMATNFDQLVYDAESEAVCSQDTFVCTGAPSNPDAAGGDACTEDSDCEADGRCIQESRSCTNNSDVSCTEDAHCTAAITGEETDGTCGEPSWLGGSCIKTGCDVMGNECANGGTCQERLIGVPICLDGCTVGMGANSADMSTWIDPVTGASGCRTGYSCVWNGVGGSGVANNGICVTTDFNSVTEPNVGGRCSDDSDCFSPFGRGSCTKFNGHEGDEFGYCTVRDCGAPDFPDADMVNVCGEDTCVVVDTDINFGFCFDNCDTGADCDGGAPGLGCIELVMGDQKHCFFGCTVTEDCQTGFTCEGATADEAGTCTAPAG